MRIATTTFVFLLIALPLIAAVDGVDGKWSGAVATPNGDLPIGFDFKADGANLTGSMIGPDGSPSPIANGKIDGNNLTFTVDLNFNGNTFSLSYKGVLDGEQIKISSEFQGQVFEFVVKKQ
jgi:hypothetical protein